jgi:hypothetical protein
MAMNKQPHDYLNEIIAKHPSLREFCRLINEDSSDVIRWRYGRNKIRARAIVAICALHPEVRPHDLNPEHFPANLRFVFGEENV